MAATAIHIALCVLVSVVVRSRWRTESVPMALGLLFLSTIFVVWIVALLAFTRPGPGGELRIRRVEGLLANVAHPRWLEGVVRRAGEDLTAPLSGRPCLGYALIFWRHGQIGHDDPLWEEQTALAPLSVVLDDGRRLFLPDGRLHLDVRFSGSSRVARSYDNTRNRLNLAAPDIAWPSANIVRRVWEAVLEDGDRVTIASRPAGSMAIHRFRPDESTTLEGAHVLAFTAAEARSLPRFHRLVVWTVVLLVPLTTAVALAIFPWNVLAPR